MLFDKKVSLESSSYRRRYLARMYDRLNNVKTAYNDYSIASSSYDPYQLKQYAEEVQYDPHQRRIKSIKKVPAEKDQYPPAKRLRSIAVSAVESISHALLYGAFAAYKYVCAEKKFICFEEPVSVCENRQHDIISQDDYIMDFTPTTNQFAAPSKPQKKPNKLCSCPIEHNYLVDDEPNKKSTDPRFDPSGQSMLNDSIYEDSVRQSFADNQEVLEDSIQASLSESIYQSSVNQPQQSVYQYYQIRRPNTIIREANVLHDIQALLEDKSSKRSFDDIDTQDESWEYIDKTSLPPPKPPRRMYKRK
ncbi:uncharacterized protein EV154DRAFT_522756 [Mucor mucedo]|uniref:uncharacterized protein n=1 Tax=Mucor mucedo TaxID=29922 RepID=UPI00221F4EB7|nr:uncharacterized protein EV154DRAFT_522756 [Mucor mucedo]KAI7883408.1 hypothetical protein EV154DRAFT_522756 [Mucor mucedo]